MFEVSFDLNNEYLSIPTLQLKHFTISMIWLRDNFGACGGDDPRWTFKVENRKSVYYFKNIDDALLFKLTWGGNI
jgi:hypothetical protein